MNRDKLTKWQERYAHNATAFEGESAKMDKREAMYKGSRDMTPIVVNDVKTTAVHVRNICAELIEAQVDSNIPAPKVTAKREKDEHLAKLIEDMIRNELDRLPFEQINDYMERIVPIQGMGGFLVEWDSSKRTHEAVGELSVSPVHPKQVVPQDGVYGNVEDMDYIFLALPQTKEAIKAKYGVDVSDESETDPSVRGQDDKASQASDLVTQIIAYYRNDNGGIGVYSWVNDVELLDLEDYQARRLRKCAVCGAVEPMDAEPLDKPVNQDGTLPDDAEPVKRDKKTCPYCGGSKWEEADQEYEELYTPVTTSDGRQIGGLQMVSDELGMLIEEPTKIPYYKPNLYPVVLQKSVSVFGQLMGESDVDAVADQYNTTARIETKIIDKLLKSGSYISLPTDAKIRADAEDMKVIYLKQPSDKSMIDVYDLQGDISADLNYLAQVYEEARQRTGITDSFQGRRDTTATSGKAKEIAAAQSAGRLESKRVMKQAAYATLFELMFKFKLAYADEPRPVISQDLYGNPQYEEFNRYDFLEQDEAGEWVWNDQFLFSCDTSAPLANNRTAMWQEVTANLQSGAFGNPAEMETLIMYWGMMEKLQYPLAGEVKAELEDRMQKQQEAMMQQQQMQQQAQAQQMQSQVDAQARRDALAEIQRKYGRTPQGNPTAY